MLIRHPPPIHPSEITDQVVYNSRRDFVRALLVGAGSLGFGLGHAAVPGEETTGNTWGKLAASPYSLRDEKLTPLGTMTSLPMF